ncbi:MAG: hypothetical protein GFH27_549305n121 [Chloroflexi bacterium AL-W]|nr:hypothetical protein [Chloroflexi bacterium AL-N1]NOK69367.1 hypothetical protein [Chloroflexi bacterium AL-N10]NOK76428.1 hypothetical protein [Chloroflexi bacterium AL-N5]NOK83545.1 hypothetical protein [Chloroflexi bacterium AL-W]NOK91205.1 hypothetical protein [Chloroflexi bacterium AL-N15]
MNRAILALAMKPYSRDTTPAAHERHVANVRAMSDAQRVHAAFEMSMWALATSMHATRRVSMSEQEARCKLIERMYRTTIHPDKRTTLKVMHQSFYDAVTRVVDVLEALDIAYYISGSVASITYGMPRTTMDVDIVAEIELQHIDSLTEQLSDNYYIQSQDIREAVRFRSSFNIFPNHGPLKIDFFIPDNRPFYRAVFGRVRYIFLNPDAPRPYALPSAEDIILLKLLWYEQGERISVQQWNDILGVIQGQFDALDRTYLRHWAAQLAVLPLLVQAFVDAGTDL